LKDHNLKDDFDLFESLTDNSSEIEVLFIERTKQLLKEG
jgi:type I restriction enzyme M protein